MSFSNTHPKEVSGYVLHQQIGAGGMGDVFQAYHPKLGRWAAIKLLQQKELAERFRNEAIIQSTINHPHIARLYETHLTGQWPCIIMEYVEGESLDRYLRHKRKLDNEEAEKLLLQMADAITYLHKKGIVHRDIKPQNFKLQPDGIIKMLDFGIAKNQFSPKLTQQGFIVGTAEYMAPEQFSQQTGLHSDLWSLGVMLYEMLTGELPFQAGNLTALRLKILKGQFTDPAVLQPGISPRLRTVIQKLLRVNPSTRMTPAGLRKTLTGAEQRDIIPSAFRTLARRYWWTVLLIIVIWLFTRTGQDSLQPEPSSAGASRLQPEQQATGEDHQRVKISVPSVEQAMIILPDGSRHPLPFEISGQEGEKKEFTLQADGYYEKKINVGITNRRNSYEYRLERIKQKE